MRTSLPDTGESWENLSQRMTDLRANDVDWRNGRASVYVFHPGDDVLAVAHRAYAAFISENGLGPAAFPSLKQMEQEVTEIALGLQRAPDNAGASMTSGGTESILLAIKTCRDRTLGERSLPGTPEIVLPFSGHPAFDKGAHLMGLKTVRVPVGADFRADTQAMADAITENTIMLVGSAPCFPYGVTDPIEELSAIALQKEIWLHVDACVGGYVAPFMREIDPGVAEYDFSLPGVRSMSADLHKYGYAAKGASTVMYRYAEDRELQIFDFDQWPCGKMATPTFAGTRPGGSIASAWAVFHYLGRAGYIANARRIRDARSELERCLEVLGLSVFGDSRLSLIAFGGADLDILAVGERLFAEHWFSSRVQDPDGIHLMISPAHVETMAEYTDVLSRAVRDVRATGATAKSRKVSYAAKVEGD